jgi:thiamine-phosphate pyrophosphorylase
VVVNDRLDVALACGADGVHLGQDDLSVRDARRVIAASMEKGGARVALGARGALLVGASTHSLDEARAAVEAGADVCGVGAMFATGTKPSVAPSGLPYLRAYLAAHGRVPHLAIGGITPANVRELAAAGCRGVAVSGTVCGADDPAAVVRALRSALEGAA